MSFDYSTDAFRFPHETPPPAGEVTQVADGIYWARLPLPMALDHVNVYVLDDGDGWCLIDAGINTPECRAAMDALFSGPLAHKPVTRVILTHHHPDHIGLAAGFVEKGAELLCSRTTFLTARMMCLDTRDLPDEASKRFWWQCGMDRNIWEKRATSRPFNFGDMCELLPLGYTRVKDGDNLRIAGRNWRVHCGYGHAPEHVTLWSDDGVILSGDQIIPGISSNIGVYATEPAANPLADWLESCERLMPLVTGEELVLPGHKLPFHGAEARLRQLIDNHVNALDRLETFLDTPKRAPESFPLLFRRKINAANYGLALVEAIAHLHYLMYAGRVNRSTDAEGVWLWEKA